jgi:MFS family permease
MTIAADIYTLEERAAVQSVLTGGWGLANVLGPVIGGWIVGHASWRWVFLVNVPVSIVAGVLLAISYRDPERKPGKVELSGPLLAGGAMALLLVALDPDSGRLLRLAFVAVGLVLGGLFLRQQRGSSQPLVPLEHLRDRAVQSGLLGGAVSGALLYSTAAYVPLWLTNRGHSALVAGFALVPMLAGWTLGSIFGVKVMIRGGMRASVGGGFAVAAIGALLLAAVVGAHEPIAYVFGALAALGIGLGPAASTSIIGPQSVVPWGARSVVTSAVYSTRMLGGALAIGLLHLWHGTAGVQVMLIAPIAVLGGVLLLGMAPADPMEQADGLDLALE